MAKRTRNDFESSSPEPEDSLPTATARLVVRPSTEITTTSTSKYLHLDSESGEGQATEMRCSLPPHRGTVTFASYEEYDVHYAKMHMNRCVECRKNFPTEHFLNLHIMENHDAMVSVLRERGEKTVRFLHSFSEDLADCDSTHVSWKIVIGSARLPSSERHTLLISTCSPKIMISSSSMMG